MPLNKASKKLSSVSVGRSKKQTEPSTNKNKLIAASLLGLEPTKTKTVSFKVVIKCTYEQFSINQFPVSMKIRDLKGFLELIAGIPFNLQRLSYLDDGELIDPKELQYYDVIDGAILMMDIWSIYLGLIKAVVLGDFKDLLKQGVSETVEWSSAASEYMFKMDKVKYIKERSGIALFTAAHRGNVNLVRSLIAIGAQINYTSSFNRTPIMIALAADKITIVDMLLDANVDIDVEDLNGENAVNIAKKFNNKLGQHRLAQFKWKKRTEDELKQKKVSKEHQEIPVFTETRLPHQVFDSSKKTWFKGNFMQVYMAHLVPPDEFSGTNLSAPKSIGIAVLKQHRLSKSNSDLNLLKDETNSETSGPIQKGLTFDKWLSQKLRAKKLEILKKKEEAKIEIIESETELGRETTYEIEPDKNIWMKDYSKQPKAIENSGRYKNTSTALKTEDMLSLSRGNNYSAMPSRLKLETNSIYKGMPYDEWTRIYEDFVKKKLEI